MKPSFPNWTRTAQDECLIVEELCRVIAGADRFQTCIEAWKAMLTVRRIAGAIRKEIREHHGPNGPTEACTGGLPSESPAPHEPNDSPRVRR